MRLRTIAYIAVALLVVIVVLAFVRILNNSDRSSITVPESSTAPNVDKNDPIYGNPEAAVQIVHFGYAGCDHCADIQEIMRAVIDDGADAYLVWEDFPNTSLAPQSLAAAIAGRCAQAQDAFWEYQPYLFQSNRLDDETFLGIANELQLNAKKFERCLRNNQEVELVQDSIDEGNALGITAVPTFFINGERYTGLYTSREIEALINEQL